jgi:hypothetical protein
MHGARVAHEVFACRRPARKEFLRILICLEPITRSAGNDHVARMRASAACDGLHVIERGIGIRQDVAAVDAVMIAVTPSGGFQGSAHCGGQTVAPFVVVAAWAASKGTPKVMPVPERGHMAPAWQVESRRPERCIHSPHWPMTSRTRASEQAGSNPTSDFASPCCAVAYSWSVFRLARVCFEARTRTGSCSAVRICTAVASSRCRDCGSAPVNGNGSSQPSPCMRGMTCTW